MKLFCIHPTILKSMKVMTNMAWQNVSIVGNIDDRMEEAGTRDTGG